MTCRLEMIARGDRAIPRSCPDHGLFCPKTAAHPLDDGHGILGFSGKAAPVRATGLSKATEAGATSMSRYRTRILDCMPMLGSARQAVFLERRCGGFIGWWKTIAAFPLGTSDEKIKDRIAQDRMEDALRRSKPVEYP